MFNVYLMIIKMENYPTQFPSWPFCVAGRGGIGQTLGWMDHAAHSYLLQGKPPPVCP